MYSKSINESTVILFRLQRVNRYFILTYIIQLEDANLRRNKEQDKQRISGNLYNHMIC